MQSADNYYYISILIKQTEHDQLLNIKLYTDKSADISNESLQDKLERCKEVRVLLF